MLHNFDIAILSFINQFSRHSIVFDETIVFIAYCNLLKGGVIIPLIWWSWFAPNRDDQSRKRGLIISTFLAAFIALCVARSMALALPLRLRPLRTPGLGFQIPLTMHHATTFGGMSAFPSDHAALFFSLAAGLFFVSRGWGLAAMTYVFVAICLPRIYLGLHYPTDILAGALIGALVACLVNRSEIVRRVFSNRLLAWCERKPGAFYAGFFLITYQIATLFQETRDLGNFGLEIMERVARAVSRMQ